MIITILYNTFSMQQNLGLGLLQYQGIARPVFLPAIAVELLGFDQKKWALTKRKR